MTNGTNQPFEALYGVQVLDRSGYARYRAEMAPILAAHEGSFGLDLWVAEILRAPSGQVFDRLFTMRFPSAAAMEAFFSDPAYLGVRRRHFEPSVSSVSRLGRYAVLP